MKGNYKHGMEGTRIYYVWGGMKRRCSNKNTKDYPRYGGRGIRVCKRWMEFKNFFQDMGLPPEGMAIDRINNDGNYEPSNCRWATIKEQNNNTRRNILLTYNGKKQSVTEWAKEMGASPMTIYHRVERGWNIDRIFTQGVRKTKDVNRPSVKYGGI